MDYIPGADAATGKASLNNFLCSVTKITSICLLDVAMASPCLIYNKNEEDRNDIIIRWSPRTALSNELYLRIMIAAAVCSGSDNTGLSFHIFH